MRAAIIPPAAFVAVPRLPPPPFESLPLLPGLTLQYNDNDDDDDNGDIGSLYDYQQQTITSSAALLQHSISEHNDQTTQTV